MVRPDRFPLTRYFLVTGLLTAVVAAVVLSTLSAREVRADLVLKSEGYAVLIARNIDRQVHERFWTPTRQRDGVADLDRPEHLAAIDSVVRLAIAELDVKKVHLFDPSGRILYSTDPQRRGGQVKPDNANFALAKAGTPSSVLVERGTPLDLGGEQEHVALLETYVPVKGDPCRVIEIYQDASHLVAETRRAGLRVGAISTIGIVALMLALWLWIRKADHTIEERNEALIQLSNDLERQVEERTRQLVRAETLASVGTLSAGVAHEVNNPIASIASCAEGLLRRSTAEPLAAQPEFEEFPEYLRIIRDEAFRVKEITRNLLDFSRTGNATQREPVDLNELLESMARLVDHRVQTEGKRIEIEAPPQPVVVQGDGASLRQLLLNVTVNAIDASPSGGTVRWTLRAANGGAELTCQDEGRGFTPEETTRALEPFFTRKPTGEGTGLGLSIAYGVARQHGGEITLENVSKGQGARVVVHLAKEGANG